MLLQGVDFLTLARHWEKEFFNDMAALNVRYTFHQEQNASFARANTEGPGAFLTCSYLRTGQDLSLPVCTLLLTNGHSVHTLERTYAIHRLFTLSCMCTSATPLSIVGPHVSEGAQCTVLSGVGGKANPHGKRAPVRFRQPSSAFLTWEPGTRAHM